MTEKIGKKFMTGKIENKEKKIRSEKKKIFFFFFSLAIA